MAGIYSVVILPSAPQHVQVQSNTQTVTKDLQVFWGEELNKQIRSNVLQGRGRNLASRLFKVQSSTFPVKGDQIQADRKDLCLKPCFRKAPVKFEQIILTLIFQGFDKFHVCVFICVFQFPPLNIYIPGCIQDDSQNSTRLFLNCEGILLYQGNKIRCSFLKKCSL